MGNAWYYDLTEDGRLSNDPEGNLVWLCGRHAEMYDDETEPAGTDSLNDGECRMCREDEMEAVIKEAILRGI